MISILLMILCCLSNGTAWVLAPENVQCVRRFVEYEYSLVLRTFVPTDTAFCFNYGITVSVTDAPTLISTLVPATTVAPDIDGLAPPLLTIPEVACASTGTTITRISSTVSTDSPPSSSIFFPSRPQPSFTWGQRAAATTTRKSAATTYRSVKCIKTIK
jgi:hypothetical protein